MLFIFTFFQRTRKNTFGDSSEDGGYRMPFFGADEEYEYREIRQLNVTVMKSCDDFTMPHLDMDESCKYE